jgi:hypothetical protein
MKAATGGNLLRHMWFLLNEFLKKSECLPLEPMLLGSGHVPPEPDQVQMGQARIQNSIFQFVRFHGHLLQKNQKNFQNLGCLYPETAPE